MNKQKYLLTKSNDGCVVYKAEKKTDPSDAFISESTFKINLKNKTFIRHKTLTYNNNQSMYIMKTFDDLKFGPHPSAKTWELWQA